MSPTTHSEFQELPRSFGPSFWVVVFLRCLLFSVLVYLLDDLMDFGTPPLLICLAAAFGVVASSILSFSSLSTPGLFILGIASYLIYTVFFSLLRLMPLAAGPRAIVPYGVELHADLLLMTLAISVFATWGFWKTKHQMTIELLFLSGFFIYLFSAHRNYQLQALQVIDTVAWKLGVGHVAMVVIFGGTVLVGVLIYLVLSTLPGKPLAKRKKLKLYTSHISYLAISIVLFTFFSILYLVSKAVYGVHAGPGGMPPQDGVGDGGVLEFHDALGGTSEPVAVVRLEGDYLENPFTPMLYLREAALSEFNGEKIVVADGHYDRDVAPGAPEEPYTKEEDKRLSERKSISQSVYLLAPHKNVFAIDYPVLIRQLKNPNVKRFKASYRAYSMAPTFSLEGMVKNPVVSLQVGDPNWSEKEWAHYLKPHTDSRYKEIAEKITAGISDPVPKAYAVSQYFSKNAIYTLSPNHNVKDGDDPVAPFLFGDMRGYCVHFAHATVYLLRALGIPARIGTGYMTDLSQSKDGHILLRMSDRHAWAEVYITGRGWIPFDTQPEKVESHGETEVDMKLLEELMSMLDPGEEILPKDILKDESNVELPGEFHFPGAKNFVFAIIFTIICLFGIKIYLRYSWAFPGSPAYKLRQSYIALSSVLHDIGVRRKEGETRHEFRDRIEKILGVNSLPIIETLNFVLYSKDGILGLKTERVDHERRVALEAVSRLSAWKRFLGAVNPSSAIASFTEARW